MNAFHRFAPAVALSAGLALLGACSGRIQPGPSGDASGVPLGVYSDCNWLLSGGTFQGAGDPSTATLTLASSGTSIAATFQSPGNPTVTLDLQPTSGSSASLTTLGQGVAGQWGFCGGGAEKLDGGGVAIADPAPTQATLSLLSAELTFDQGAIFFQMDGTVIDVQGQPGCAPDQPPSRVVSALLVCDGSSGARGQGVAAGPADAAAPASTNFVAGTYNCSSDVSTVVANGGVQDNSTVAGGPGVLTLAVSGDTVTTTYSGDTSVSGTLDFLLTSDRSANPAPGQTVDVNCGRINSDGPTSPVDPTVTQVSAGALTTDGTTLYLTFLGNTPSGDCSGQTATTVLQCTWKGP